MLKKQLFVLFVILAFRPTLSADLLLKAGANRSWFANEGGTSDSSQKINKRTDSSTFYLEIGLGKAPSLFYGKGTSLGLFFNYSRRQHFLSARALGNMEYFMKAGPMPVEVYSDLSLLWGYKLFVSQSNSIIALVGAGKTTSIKRGKLIDNYSVDAKHEKLTESTFGISIGMKFQANTKLTAYSLYAFSNINSIQSYYGILVCFGLGKIQ